MIGAGKPPSRACPVVLDETVAASFAGLIGGGLDAKAVQRGRSPFAGRLGEEVASSAFALHDDGRDPAGPASAPFDGEGVPRRRTALIEDGRLRSYLYDTYTANREGGASTGSAARQGYRSLPSVSTSNLMVAPGSHSREQLLAEAGDGIYVTDVAGLHSGVNPVTSVSRSAPPAARSAAGGWRSRSASSRSPASWWRCWAPSAPPERSPAGSHSAARSAPRRCWSRRWRSAVRDIWLQAASSYAEAAVRLRPSSNPEEEFRRDQG